LWRSRRCGVALFARTIQRRAHSTLGNDWMLGLSAFLRVWVHVEYWNQGLQRLKELLVDSAVAIVVVPLKLMGIMLSSVIRFS
jgi:hypothetical protein